MTRSIRGIPCGAKYVSGTERGTPRRWRPSRRAGSRSRPAGSGRRPPSARSRTRSGASSAGRGFASAVGLPAAAVGDPPEFLDVHVHQLAGPVAFVADRGDLRGPDHLAGDRVALVQVRHAGGGAGSATPSVASRPSSAPIQSWPRRSRAAQLEDALLDLGAGPGRHRVRSRGPVDQPGLAFGGEAVDPGLHALAGDAHRRGDVGLGPAGLMPLDDQQTAVDGQCGHYRGTREPPGWSGP